MGGTVIFKRTVIDSQRGSVVVNTGAAVIAGVDIVRNYTIFEFDIRSIVEYDIAIVLCCIVFDFTIYEVDGRSDDYNTASRSGIYRSSVDRNFPVGLCLSASDRNPLYFQSEIGIGNCSYDDHMRYCSVFRFTAENRLIDCGGGYGSFRCIGGIASDEGNVRVQFKRFVARIVEASARYRCVGSICPGSQVHLYHQTPPYSRHFRVW